MAFCCLTPIAIRSVCPPAFVRQMLLLTYASLIALVEYSRLITWARSWLSASCSISFSRSKVRRDCCLTRPNITSLPFLDLYFGLRFSNFYGRGVSKIGPAKETTMAAEVTASNGQIVSVVTWFLLVTSSLSVFIRLATKWAMVRKMHVDDLLVLMSLVCIVYQDRMRRHIV